MATRIFTPTSARECAGRLLPVVRLMCRLLRELDGSRERAGEPDGPVARPYFARVEGFLAAVRRIEASGARVKNARTGLLDFPARRAGRQVYLCWWIGEPRVAFWHEPGAGLDDRRPVDEDGPWDEAAG